MFINCLSSAAGAPSWLSELDKMAADSYVYSESSIHMQLHTALSKPLKAKHCKSDNGLSGVDASSQLYAW